MSSAEQFRKALECFESLAEASTAERHRRLEDLQRDQPDLASAVRDLFSADGEEGLDVPFDPDRPFDPAAHFGLDSEGGTRDGRDARGGERVGPYEIRRLLGEGGMGAVWEAERVDGGFEQRVAIKFLRHLGLGPRAERRFAFEREVLGKLQHPAIAGILDAGRTAAGEPYLVMEYVDGVPIDEYCDRHALSVRERVRLVIEICHVVSHAHRCLVVHRDLKPANILVTGEGEPRLLDFGIAKLLADDEERAALTAEGLVPMTVEYASPEQVRGLPVTTASDVYSLGVVLYRLLTGRTPFGEATASPLELGRRVAQENVTAPSAAVGSDSKETGDEGRAVLESRDVSSFAQLRRELRGDLDNVTLRALRRDPERRYPSVDALAADLDRWLRGFPVEARGDSLTYRGAKFLRRNWIAVAAAALVFVSLSVSLGVATWNASEAREQRDRADDHARRTELVNRFLVDLLAAPGGRWWRGLENQGPDTRVIEVLDEAAARLETDLEAAPLQRATLHQTLNDTYLALGLPERAEDQVRRALELRRSELGELHPAVAESTYYLAATLRDQNRFPEALELYREALGIESRLPEPTGNYPFALSEAAGTASRIGLHAEVEGLMNEALDVARARDSILQGHLLGLRANYRAERGELPSARAGTRRSELWFRTAAVDSGVLHQLARASAAEVAWLSDDLRTAMRIAESSSSDRMVHLRAHLLYDLGRYREAGDLLETSGRELLGHLDVQVLAGRLALVLDGDAERCLERVEPAWRAEENWSRGPTWQLAEARSALAACKKARGRAGDAERADELLASARETLDALFEEPTPLHRRLEPRPPDRR